MNTSKIFNIRVIAIFIVLNILSTILLGSDYYKIIIPVNASSFLLIHIYYLSIKYGSTVFHPLPLVCLIFFLSFVFAPIISLGFDVYLLFAPRLIDWNKWLVITSWLYFVGIFFFYLGSKLSFRSEYNAQSINIDLNKKKLIVVSILFLIITLVSQAYVFYKFGGFISYLTRWSESRDEFAGMGVWYMLAEPFPVILLLFIILLIDKSRLNKNIFNIVIIFSIFFALKLIFGGLRGSRSNTIWGIFWFAGIVHIYLFRLRKIHILAGVLFLATFMSVYTIYKTYGIDSFSGDYTIEDTNRFENNPLIEIYLGDFSRGTINTYQISQIEDLSSYEYKYGQTYISSIIKVIPPLKELYYGHSKNSAGAEIVSNIKVSPTQDDIHNSRVFGLYGEAILNFGIFIGLISFFIFGVIATTLDNLSRKYLSRNIYVLVIPFVSNIAFTLLLSDSDNLVFFAFKNGLIVLLYLYIVNKTCNTKVRYTDKYLV